MPEALMRVEEVAEALNVSPLTVYRRIESGQLAEVKLGETPQARLRVEREELARFIRSHRIRASEQEE